MTNSHKFGGTWTQKKLTSIRDYLEAYIKIMYGKKVGGYFTTYYVDAFAGTGYIEIPQTAPPHSENDAPEDSPMLFTNENTSTYNENTSTYDADINNGVYHDGDTKELQKGSAAIALDISQPFHHYIFIEKNRNHVKQLHQLKESSDISERITIEHAEANTFLQKWCRTTNWRRKRAVLFLDPYGMEVEWETLESVAATKAIDMFLLHPFTHRLLTRRGLPSSELSTKLTKLFGTSEWEKVFYGQPAQTGLFDDGDEVVKKVTSDGLKNYFIERLETIFPCVSKEAKMLNNSKNSPLFLLCFAASNEKGGRIALNIADHLLKNI